MPTPKRKVSKARRDKRAANKGYKPKVAANCQTCKAPLLSHQACKECGYYKGKKILKTKSERMFERGKARQAKEQKMSSVVKKDTSAQDNSAKE